VPRELSRWPALKCVHLLAAGIDHLLGHPVWKSPVAVYTASGTNAQPIAEYVSMMVIMLHSSIYQALKFPETRDWQQRFKYCARNTLVGKTAGIVGYGNIGREVARQLTALGMQVVTLKKNPASRTTRGFNPFPGTGDPEGKLPIAWFDQSQIRDMLPLCDVLIICAPRTPENTDLIRLPELKLMRNGAIVVVVSRGGIVNEADLAVALHSKVISAAAVDCYLQEPPAPSMPLFTAPNCLLTPHLAGVFSQSGALQYQLLSENVERFVKGQPLLNVVSVAADV
jgi:phosphoglycerate dehydrogenase-like enzyme